MEEAFYVNRVGLYVGFVLIALSHIMFGAVVCLAVRIVLKLLGIRSPPTLFYPFTLFMMEFPDVDHLFQMEVTARQLVPFTIWDLFRWQLRTEYLPFTFLHYWAYPLVMLLLLALPLRLKRAKWVMTGAFLGWSTHLVLDGVLLFI
nr:hypothetical protein [Candidatus Njordarchaeum guaymaensis]